MAYAAASGTQLWVAHYDPGAGGDGPVSMAISQNGAELVVTGDDTTGPPGSSVSGYATVAYRTSDGHQLWGRLYPGPRGGADATSVVMSPDGTKVFVTGSSPGNNSTLSYATLAYQA